MERGSQGGWEGARCALGVGFGEASGQRPGCLSGRGHLVSGEESWLSLGSGEGPSQHRNTETGTRVRGKPAPLRLL